MLDDSIIDIFETGKPLSPAERARLEKLRDEIDQQTAVVGARDSLLQFARLMSPDRNEPHNFTKSRYVAAPHHKLIIEALERVEAGLLPRLIITMPPRHGKSETITRIFPPWFLGRDTSREVIIAGYSQNFAERSFGKKIQEMMRSERYMRVFPEATLDGGSKAVDFLGIPNAGGIIVTGRDGATTGHGAHLFVVDDPIKNRKEADSQVLRDTTWEWFTSTVNSRLYDDGAIVIVMTRWNEDDIVGRLTNPDHPDYDPELAAGWETLCLPAVFEDRHFEIAEVLGRKVGDVLWPKEGKLGFSKDYFDVRRRLSEADFEALYQGNPTPMKGDFFRAEWLDTYTSDQLPATKFISTYGASDHAVSTRNRADASIMGCFGVDEYDTVWVLPDLVWDRIETDKQIDEMIAKMKYHRPLAWFIESENIAKAFGPFLMKRMSEERVYTVLEPKTPSKDKSMRAQAIRGRLANRKVKFPADAHWWPAARRQLLAFPNAADDDFVDFISWIGQGLLDITPGASQRTPELDAAEIPGTLAWVKAATRAQEDKDKRYDARRTGY